MGHCEAVEAVLDRSVGHSTPWKLPDAGGVATPGTDDVGGREAREISELRRTAKKARASEKWPHHALEMSLPSKA